jgi:hypothetical protein
MARKVGVLSDEHFRRHCLEYQPMKVGLAQRMFPLNQNSLAGVPIPSVLPVAQRGYNLQQTAISLAQRTNRPVEDVISMLLKESKQVELKRVFRPSINVSTSKEQPSLLAVSVKQRESDFDQLNRVFITPAGNVVAKSGRLNKFQIKEMEDNDETGSTASEAPTERQMSTDERM